VPGSDSADPPTSWDSGAQPGDHVVLSTIGNCGQCAACARGRPTHCAKRFGEASFVVSNLYEDRSIMGCRYGRTQPHHDIPLIVRFYLDGRFMLDEMVSRTYELGDIDQALADLAAGRLNRGVLALT
jgi:Zn-dependent alcohol dehydrogenase